GIEIAKREHRFKGRKEVKIDDTTFNKQYELYERRKITKTQMAEKLNISRPTLDKLLKEKAEK
ncbi:MAG: helix-turn-helix domain-containing protein, partial [Clostridia bacterium]|nr:helix-turn-helix domain-containing protein [Clostridia bacterium]